MPTGSEVNFFKMATRCASAPKSTQCNEIFRNEPSEKGTVRQFILPRSTYPKFNIVEAADLPEPWLLFGHGLFEAIDLSCVHLRYEHLWEGVGSVCYVMLRRFRQWFPIDGYADSTEARVPSWESGSYRM